MLPSSEVAVVTGAANGIGRAVALRFGREGKRLVLVDNRGDDLDETKALLSRLGVVARCCRVDVTCEAAVQNVFTTLLDDPPHILVTCAGITAESMVHETTITDWIRVVETNLTGSFLPIRAVLPLMLQARRGTIVTLGSISASVIGAGGGCAAYEASKAGVLQLTRAVAVEYAEFGIRANCVGPGRIRTKLGEHARLANQVSARCVGRTDVPRRVAPLKAAGDPDEVAAAVAFLCSKEASFITGANIVIDGGYTAL